MTTTDDVTAHRQAASDCGLVDTSSAGCQLEAAAAVSACELWLHRHALCLHRWHLHLRCRTLDQQQPRPVLIQLLLIFLEDILVCTL